MLVRKSQERTTRIVALGVAVTLIGLFAAIPAWTRNRPFRLRVISQTSAPSGLASRGSGVYLQLKGEGGEASRGRDHTTRFIDAGGQEYRSTSYVGNVPLPKGWRWVALGYRKTPRATRMIVTEGGRVIQETPLETFPKPKKTPAHPSQNAPVRAFLNASGADLTTVEATQPIPSDEFWDVALVATRFAQSLCDWPQSQVRSLTAPAHATSLDIPYAQTAEWARLRITKYRHTVRSGLIRLRGTRLRVRGGQTGFDLPHPVTFRKVAGYDVTLSEPAAQATRSRDRRQPRLDVTFVPSYGALDSGIPELRVVAPTPDMLGVQAIEVGDCRLMSKRWLERSPVRERFDVTIKISARTPWKRASVQDYDVPLTRASSKHR